MRATIKENEAKVALKAAALEREKAEDVRIAAQYAAMLEAQEAARVAGLKALHDRSHARAQAAGEGAVKAAREREAEDEARVVQLQAERAEAEAEAAAAKRARAAEATRNQLAVLALQVGERGAAHKAVQDDLRRHTAAVLAADEAAAAAEAGRAAARRERDVAHAAFLGAQAKAKRDAAALGHLMSDRERLLNAKRLEEAKAMLVGTK